MKWTRDDEKTDSQLETFRAKARDAFTLALNALAEESLLKQLPDGYVYAVVVRDRHDRKIVSLSRRALLDVDDFGVTQTVVAELAASARGQLVLGKYVASDGLECCAMMDVANVPRAKA